MRTVALRRRITARDLRIGAFGAAVALALLAATASAGAATVRCRIEKPARRTYGDGEAPYGLVRLSRLVAKNLPQHHTLGGSPCATANQLAWQYEFDLTSGEVQAEDKGDLTVVKTQASDQPGSEAPQLEWQVGESEYEEPPGRGTNFRYTATFNHGRERVSVRVLYHFNETL